jgi:flagellar hook protein FlgE
MYSAISGLQANSTWLDVIGNNISNVNTVAYKSSRAEFASAFSQTLNAGTGDNTGSNLGGINPEQIGLGTRIASIQTIWTEGALQQTGVSTDIAIQGNGFLVSKSGANTLYTRAGNLTFDSQGNLVDQSGGLIQGFTATVKYNQTEINTVGAAGTGPMEVTYANLQVNNSNLSAASNIQINPNFVEPAKATSQLNFVGNLDSFQPAQPLILSTAGVATLPMGLLGAATFNAGPPPKAQILAYPPAPGAANENVMQQIQDLATGVDANNILGPHTTPVMGNAETLNAIQLPANAVNENFAWNQQPPITPALTSSQTCYDSTGTPHTVTTLFYQVNDLGQANPPINPSPLNQAAYAWYSFDTTNGAAVSTATLLGGTGIYEGSGQTVGAQPDGYNRGNAGDTYFGDLIYFNSDGSLASMGAVQDAAGVLTQCQAHVYLPASQVAAPPQPAASPTPVSPIPTLGAEIMDITMNFGTAGYTAANVAGAGANGIPLAGTIVGAKRDGLFSDAEGTYQVINGVNTYVADSHATTSQNGYADGTLTTLSFDETGTIQGQFTNGQTTALGQVLMASVENVNGLEQVGDNYYNAGPNAGAQTLGLAGANGMGTIQGGYLENSNVDLTTELSNMIIAQRGFDVNSRVIAVENANLQVLTQLGQGG